MGDCNGKSERINDHVSGVHLAETIIRKLEAAEHGGFVEQSAEEMLSEFKASVERGCQAEARYRVGAKNNKK